MSARSFFLSFIFITLTALGFSNSTDPDFFWHIKTGELILTSGFPDGDPFSFTKLGSFWHLHEWLSEVLMYYLYVNFPHYVLSGLFAVFIILTFVLVYKRCEEKPYIASFATFITAYVSGISWGVRPQVFNMLGASLFIFVLEKIRKGERGFGSYILLFGSLILWVNLHAGAVLGTFLIMLFTALNFIKPIQNEIRPKLLVAVGLVFISILCLTLSPNGVNSLFYPFETLTSPAMRAYIDEWHSPDFHSDIGMPFYFLLMFTFFILLISRVTPSISDGVLILGSLAQALMSYRNIPFFCICIAPYLSKAIGELFSRRDELASLVNPPPIKETLGVKILFSVLTISFLAYGLNAVIKTYSKESEEITKNFPVEAVAKLKEFSAKRVYNFYSWGGYMIWNELPVLIDGRADMYGDEFFHKYSEVANVKKNAYETLESFKVDYVLFPTESSLVPFLKANGQYEQIYEDKLATILKRKGS